jgi:hypothetical protein
MELVMDRSAWRLAINVPKHNLFFFFCSFVFLCFVLLLPLFLVGFIFSLPQLAWDKWLSCCCCFCTPFLPYPLDHRSHPFLHIIHRNAPLSFTSQTRRCCPLRPRRCFLSPTPLALPLSSSRRPGSSSLRCCLSPALGAPPLPQSVPPRPGSSSCNCSGEVGARAWPPACLLRSATNSRHLRLHYATVQLRRAGALF